MQPTSPLRQSPTDRIRKTRWIGVLEMADGTFLMITGRHPLYGEPNLWLFGLGCIAVAVGIACLIFPRWKWFESL